MKTNKFLVVVFLLFQLIPSIALSDTDDGTSPQRKGKACSSFHSEVKVNNYTYNYYFDCGKGGIKHFSSKIIPFTIEITKDRTFFSYAISKEPIFNFQLRKIKNEKGESVDRNFAMFICKGGAGSDDTVNFEITKDITKEEYKLMMSSNDCTPTPSYTEFMRIFNKMRDIYMTLPKDSFETILTHVNKTNVEDGDNATKDSDKKAAQQ